MDIKTEILKLQRTTADNPGLIAVVIVALIATVFVAIILIDAFVRRRKRKPNRRAK